MFTMSIELGNDGMREARDVAEALEETARKLDGGRTEGNVVDVNGNTVGQWHLELNNLVV